MAAYKRHRRPLSLSLSRVSRLGLGQPTCKCPPAAGRLGSPTQARTMGAWIGPEGRARAGGPSGRASMARPRQPEARAVASG